MSVVVVVVKDITSVVEKKDVTIVYTKNGKCFVCEKTPPVDLGNGLHKYILKARRS